MHRKVFAGVVSLVFLVVLYSLLLAGNIAIAIAAVEFLVLGYVLYLLGRVMQAVERIAENTEHITENTTGSHDDQSRSSSSD